MPALTEKPPAPAQPRHGGRLPPTIHLHRRALIAAAAISAILAGARLALPSFLRWEINRRLNQIPEYSGHVDSVRVALWRGAYALEGLSIVKRTATRPIPLLSANEIDFSLAWRELIRGRVLGDMIIQEGRINFVKAPSRKQSELDADSRWRDAFRDIFPLHITFLQINDGQLRYRDLTATPAVDVFIDHMRLLATGLRNRPGRRTGNKPAHLEIAGDSIGGGHLNITADGRPLARRPEFELHLSLKDVSLPSLNEFLQAYGGIDVRSGSFQIYLEVAARDGRFEGYAKPFFTDMKLGVLKHKTVLEDMWQVIAGGLVDLLKNQSRDQLATRIPFSGEFGKTEIDSWATIMNMLHHGFIHPLPTGLEHSVHIETVPPPPKPVQNPPAPPGS
jgi:hypothetical protein